MFEWLGLGGKKSPVEVVGEIVDELWDSDEEKMTAENLKTKIMMAPDLAQAKINEIQMQHRSVFVAGARPFLLWVCGIGYAFAFLINPIIQWSTGSPGPELPMDSMGELTLGMLGLAGLRTVEKLKQVSR